MFHDILVSLKGRMKVTLVLPRTFPVPTASYCSEVHRICISGAGQPYTTCAYTQLKWVRNKDANTVMCTSFLSLEPCGLMQYRSHSRLAEFSRLCSPGTEQPIQGKPRSVCTTQEREVSAQLALTRLDLD